MEDAAAVADDWPFGGGCDLEAAGGINHWLPAYGYQQPTQLHQALLQQGRDADLLACDAVAAQQFVFLETILEETSDDLQSESDRSGTVGWPDTSDSDTDSVIHVTNDVECVGNWSGSERDLAVPKKRRRRSPDDPDDDGAASEATEECGSLSSRSSSLIQFECLERHCETVFRTCSASSEPSLGDDTPSPDSCDSLERATPPPRWADSLEDPASSGDDDDDDSDDTLRLSSWSSSRASSFRSSGRLRSFRSLDSLNLLQQGCAGTVRAPDPPPATKTPGAPPQEPQDQPRSAENLSEDSGFGDQEARRGGEDDSCCSDCSSGAKERAPTETREGDGADDANFSGGGGGPWRSAPQLDEGEQSVAAPSSPGPEVTCSAPDLLADMAAAGREVRFSPTVDRVSWGEAASALVVRRVQVGVPVGPAEERCRVVLEVPADGGSVRADMEPNGGGGDEEQQRAAPGKKSRGRFGGFFQRFSLRRLGGKKARDKPDKKSSSPPPPPVQTTTTTEYEDVRIVPLHGPGEEERAGVVVVASKPPLPPRRRPDAPAVVVAAPAVSVAAGMSGLLETDLDAAGAVVAGPAGKKARSLADLGAGAQPLALPPPGARDIGAADARARSMEFLLDKENQAAVKPPENELQKGERVMSEHQLRVQRSLQKLNVPDWYKNSSAARTPEGWLRGQQHREHRDGWPGLSSKTTSLSSLGSTHSAVAAAPRSPTSQLLSPGATPHVFTRWSTSRLNSSTATSTSTSPCGSTRSSFNYRQPYLGWRSQERLARPRTPAERLAAGLLPAASSPDKEPSEEDKRHAAQVPNLSEVRTSIKEVTSAIVHYVSNAKGGSGEMLGLDGGQRADQVSLSPRSNSPRGSGRLCWLESSFVGTRPLDSPETPSTLPGGTDVDTLELDSMDRHLDGGIGKMGGGGELYLDLEKTRPLSRQQRQLNGEYLLT